MSLFTVITTMALGVVWEIGEFGIDQIFGYHTQPDLYDTMLDLILDTIGAIIVAGFFYFGLKKGTLENSLNALSKSVGRLRKKR